MYVLKCCFIHKYKTNDVEASKIVCITYVTTSVKLNITEYKVAQWLAFQLEGLDKYINVSYVPVKCEFVRLFVSICRPEIDWWPTQSWVFT